MKNLTVIVAMSGSTSFSLEVDYDQQKNDKENIFRALSFATLSAVNEALQPPETLYEAIFELKDGKRILGYSAHDEPTSNGKFYHCAATKELKGRVVVLAENVTSFRFAPL